MIINHNISALNTLNKLKKNNKLNGNVLEKLSSGSKINQASDDSAGLAISEKMRAQIRGLEQAQRNIQDGISLIQTAESGLASIQTPPLQRLRELAIQASNDALTNTDRQKIQEEVEQIKRGINEIANNTAFNGIDLLNNKPKTTNETELIVTGNAGFSWEYVDSETHASLNSITWNGNMYVAVGSNSYGAGNASGKGTILTSSDGKSWNEQFTDIKTDLSSIVWTGNKFVATGNNNILTSTDGINWTYQEIDLNGSITSLVSNGNILVAGTSSNSLGNGVLISINGEDWSFHNKSFGAIEDIIWDKGMFVAVQGGGDISTSTDGVNWVNQSSPVSGPAPNRLYGIASNGNQFVAVGDTGKIVTSPDGVNWMLQTSNTINDLHSVSWNGFHFVAVGTNDILISEDGATWERTLYGANWSNDVTWGNGKFVAVGYNGHILISEDITDTNTITTTEPPLLSFQVGANSGENFQIELTNVTTKALGIDDIDFSTRIGAESAISKIDNALKTVTSERSKFGSYQNRLEHIYNNASNYEANLTSSESRIRDADLAKQMMDLTKGQILSQASQAMLAHSFNQPQQILQLL